MLQVDALVKRYGQRTVVDGVSLSIARGECFGLLGPNGAGKTTTISMICGILAPDAGTVTLSGEPAASDAAKRRIGYVPQELALYEELDAVTNLRVFGSLYGVSRTTLTRRMDEVLAVVGLGDRRRERVSTFSGGMKRRLNIAIAMLHDPDLLIFDEPTVGVDPQSRNAIFDALKGLQAAGKTLIYTTHYMEEVERLCDRIAIMDHGKIVASDTLQGLARLAGSATKAASRIRIELEPDPAISLNEFNVTNNTLTLDVNELSHDLAAVLTTLHQKGVRVRGLTSDDPSAPRGLESVFLQLTGRSLRD